MILDEGRMKLREITENTGISKERVGYTRKGLQA